MKISIFVELEANRLVNYLKSNRITHKKVIQTLNQIKRSRN